MSISDSNSLQDIKNLENELSKEKIESDPG
jgi:hypothetical protein